MVLEWTGVDEGVVMVLEWTGVDDGGGHGAGMDRC